MANQIDISRLVYPPKAWVFVKNSKEEVMDLTDYVVGGEVSRKLNQVSSLEIKLRNPNMRFTTRGKKRAAFHPMDPITVFLERMPGRHVQVFTGYLDQTPYLQLFPGVITLKASCTLKRLEYTYFQMAQQYTLRFLEHFGWHIQADGTLGPHQGGEVETAIEEGNVKKWRKEEEEKKITHAQFNEKFNKQYEAREKTKKDFESAGGEGAKRTPKYVPFSATPGAKFGNDGSFSKIVWAILYYMGDWRDENIYIEAMPPDVPGLIASLWADFTEGGQEEAKKELEVFWKALVGTSSQGSGGGPGNGSTAGPSGNLKNINQIVSTMKGTAERFGLPPEFVITTSLCETSFNQKNITTKNGVGAIGWFQFTSSEPYPGIKVKYPEDAMDTRIATEDFCKAAAALLKQNISLAQEDNWQKWAEETQKPGVGGYNESWSKELAHSRELVSKYGKEESSESGSPEETKRSKTQGQGGETEGTKPEGNSKTRITAMEEEAKNISAKKYPYSYGGGHEHAGSPSVHPEHSNGEGPTVNGFDCAGSVAAVLAAGGYVVSGSPVPTSGSFGQLKKQGWAEGPGSGNPEVSIYYNSQHAWMTINGQYFSTGWGADGAHLGSSNPTEQPNKSEYTVVHLTSQTLKETYSGPEPPPLTGEGGVEEGGIAGGGEGGNLMSQETAASFLSQIQYPSAEEMAKAQIIGGQRSLMNATPLLPFIQQVCESSLRSFQSLPNGDFYAFYPDYFGEFGHHEPYWEIHNIEIIDGEIDLNDENLVTHVFTIGNTIWPANEEILNEINAGVMTIFEAFEPGILLHNEEAEKTPGEHEKLGKALSKDEAVRFLQRYGARPKKMEYPMVYSTLFESLLAYQQFLLAWSRQFKSVFTFTFMPELFPGGKVAFPEHGLQCFIESVNHSWTLEEGGGFQTVCELIAPSVYKTSENQTAVEELPDFMVDALIEPQRGLIAKKATAPKEKSAYPMLRPINTRPLKAIEEKNQQFGPGPGERNNALIG